MEKKHFLWKQAEARNFEVLKIVRSKTGYLNLRCKRCDTLTKLMIKTNRVAHYTFCRAQRIWTTPLKRLLKRTNTFVEAEWIHKGMYPSKSKQRLVCKHGKTHVRGKYAPSQFNCTCTKAEYASRVAKREATMMARYGQRNPMQVPEFFSKHMKSSFSFKYFVWPSGAITKY